MHRCALWLLHLELYIIQFTSGETSLKLSQVKAILSQCEIITHMAKLAPGLVLGADFKKRRPSSYPLIRYEAPTVCLVLGLGLGCCSTSVVSNSLWPHGLQRTRLSCPSLSPRVCSNSCPSSWWCHPTISSSVASFSSSPPLSLSQHQGQVCVCVSEESRTNELALGIRWPNYWSFGFRNHSSNEYSVDFF